MQSVRLRAEWTWADNGILVDTKSDATHAVRGIKEPTIVHHNGTYHLFATIYTGNYSMVYLNFTSLDQAASAPWYYMDQTPGFGGYRTSCSPQLFYLSLQGLWYLVFQQQASDNGATTNNAMYSTNADISNPAGWAPPRTMLDITVANAVDFWTICDDSYCYLFFADNRGHLFSTYTSSAVFPGYWESQHRVLHSENPLETYGAPWIYRLQSEGVYLAGIEGIDAGGHRFYQTFTADSLWAVWPSEGMSQHGFWAAQSRDFVTSRNVNHTWGQGIGQGELMRANADERMLLDPCVRLVYQGLAPGDYKDNDSQPFKLESSECCLASLPDVVAAQCIVALLDLPSRSALYRTCRHARRLCLSESLWRSLVVPAAPSTRRRAARVPLARAAWPRTTECLDAFVDGVAEAAASVAGHAVALRRVEMSCSEPFVQEWRYAYDRPLARLIAGGTVQLPHLEHVKEDIRARDYDDPDPLDQGGPAANEFRRFARAVALQCPSLRVWECHEANEIMIGTCCCIEQPEWIEPLLSLCPETVETVLACSPATISLSEVRLSPSGSQQLARFLSLCHRLRLVRSADVCQQLLSLVATLPTSEPLLVCSASSYCGSLEFEAVPTALRADGLRLGNPALLRGMLQQPMFSELGFISLLFEDDPAALYACLDTLGNAAPGSLSRLMLHILPDIYGGQPNGLSVDKVCAGVRRLRLSELCFELRYDIGLWKELLLHQDMMPLLRSLRRLSVLVTYSNPDNSGILVNTKSDSTHAVKNIKDPTIVYYNGVYHVYATIYSTSYSMVYLNFSSFDKASSAKWYYMDKTAGFTGYKCAPQLFYFEAKKLWYLVFQTPYPTYSTNTNPGNPAGWSTPKAFFTTMPTNAIDFWTICDDANCFLFFSNDAGVWYRTQTSKSVFPNGWSTTFTTVLKSSNKYEYFEASWVYRLSTQKLYIAGIEGIGSSGRYYQTFTATSLDGQWTSLTTGFASNSNVKFTSSSAWSQGDSRADLLLEFLILS
eukprot:m51a1_g3721 putative beta- -xylanase (1001) ;mRNA; f:466619-482220